MRESVLAYKFVVCGVIPFNPSDPASFADAQRELEELRTRLTEGGDAIEETTYITTRKMAKAADGTLAAAMRDSE